MNTEFYPINVSSWDRREIFETFYGYTYALTVELDITEFLQTLHEKGYKFYPSICYCITKTINEHQEYRYAKIHGEVGFWNRVNPHYTVLRTNTNHLFAHQRTLYSDDFDTYYRQFLLDKAAAEAGNELYFDKSKTMDNCHISIMPSTSQSGLSYSKPPSFTGYGMDTTSFIPFTMIGKYREMNGRTMMPVTTEFHHNVNDGYHAEQFFLHLQEICRNFLR